MPDPPSARTKPSAVRRASATSAAFRSVTFSRASRPMRPSSCDRVMAMPGATLGQDFRRLLFELGIERREHRTRSPTAPTPASRICRAGVAHGGAVEGHDRQAVDLVPAADHEGRGLRPAHAGRPASRRTAAASRPPAGRCARQRSWPRCRRWTTALVKCVVPIITASMRAGSTALSASRSSQRRDDAVPTSGVVAVLTAWRTRRPSIRTASVLVPPTSMPMRIIGRSPERWTEVEVVAEGARADMLEPLGDIRMAGAGRAITVTRWP